MENLFIKWTEPIVQLSLCAYAFLEVLELFVGRDEALESIKRGLYRIVVMLTLIFIYLKL